MPARGVRRERRSCARARGRFDRGRSAAARRGRSARASAARASPAPAWCRARAWPANSSSMICRAGRLVEIAGRLVGDQDRRIGRQRAGERDALLLAAGQLRRIMVRAARPSPTAASSARARARTRRRRRRARAAPRRSPAPSWSGSGGRTGTRCRHCGRGSAPARPRRACPGPAPATATVPVSGRSSPAITISSVDLPEPDGPTRPTASPRAYMQIDILEDMDAGGAVAEREIDAGQRDRRRPAWEVSFMRAVAPFTVPLIWEQWPSWSSALRLLLIAALSAGPAGAGAGPRTGRSRSWRSAIRSPPASACRAGAAFPASSRRRSRPRASRSTIVNAGVPAIPPPAGLARLDWSVPDGTDAVILELGANDALRGLDPKVTASALDAILDKLKARHIAVLLAGMLAPPQYGRRLCASAFDAIYPALAVDSCASSSIRSSSTASPPIAKLNQRDGMHPTAAGVDVIVARILPKVEELIARCARSADDARASESARRSVNVPCRVCSPASKFPPTSAQSLVDAARRAAGRALDRSGKLSSDAALHRRRRRRDRARGRLAARPRASAAPSICVSTA